MNCRLTRPFFARSAREVAVDLLGMRMVRDLDGNRIAGIIVETEAYCDAEEPDLACHGDRVNSGRPTKRTAIMFGRPGVAYVYFTYGIHWMFNIVTGAEGQANAVLVRALEPVEGMALMRLHRERPDEELTNGPAKLAQALAIDGGFNGIDLCEPGTPLWLEQGVGPAEGMIASGPRIGLGKTPEPWFSKPWRYWVKQNRYVSR